MAPSLRMVAFGMAVMTFGALARGAERFPEFVLADATTAPATPAPVPWPHAGGTTTTPPRPVPAPVVTPTPAPAVTPAPGAPNVSRPFTAPVPPAVAAPVAPAVPGVAAGAGGAGPVPVPGKTECQAALTAIQKDHVAEYADKAPLAKETLGNKLLLEAHGMSDGSARRYELLREAARLAATVGDFDLVNDALNELRNAFAIDVEATSLELYDIIAPVVKLPAQQRTLSLMYSNLVPLAWAREDFGSAGKYNTRALNMARVAGDAGLASAAAKRAGEITEAEQAFPETLLARRKLIDAPEDATANGVVGRFLCLYKGDFDAGLPLLAKSDLADLKDLAARELALKAAGGAGGGDVLTVLAVAEAWRERGEKATGLVRRNALLRARAGYDQFMTNEDALRSRVRSFMQKIDTEFPALPAVSRAATQPAKP